MVNCESEFLGFYLEFTCVEFEFEIYSNSNLYTYNHHLFWKTFKLTLTSNPAQLWNPNRAT
jgi:hypothetical protein